MKLFNKFLVLLFIVLFPIKGLAVDESDYFITTWKTDNPGDSNDTSIKIPMLGGSYDVDWNNDGVIDETGLSGDLIHDFGTAGTYTVRIYNTTIDAIAPRIYFDNTGDKNKIISINQWGTGQWSSMSGAFYGCENLESNATDKPDLSNVTDMQNMFRDATKFNSDINDWNVSNVTNMSYMFYSTNLNSSNFNQPLNNWDVSSVTDMTRMFYRAYKFNQPLNDWNVSNVTYMLSMFDTASSFNQPLDDWNVGNVINMETMFQHTNSFNQPLNNWNVSSVTNMFGMFYDAPSFNQPLNDWNVTNVTQMPYMFQKAYSFDQDLGDWNVSNVTNMSDMLLNSNLSTANYDRILIGWDKLTLKQDVPFSAGTTPYCLGESARADMNDSASFNWTITDEGKDCSMYPPAQWNYKVDKSHTGQSPNNGFASNPYLKWEFNSNLEYTHSPAIAKDSTIYFADGTKDTENIYAINSDGTKKWAKTDANNINSETPINSDGTMYVYNGKGYKIIAYNPDGSKKWDIPILRYTVPTISDDGTLYVNHQKSGTSSHYFTAYYDNNGSEKCKYYYGEDVGYYGYPTIAPNREIYTFVQGNLYSFDRECNINWTMSSIGDAVHSYYISPVVDNDGTTYILTESGDNYVLNSINPDTQTINWSKSITTANTTANPPASITMPAVATDGTIYIASNDNKLYAIDPANGNIKWTFSTNDSIYTYASPIIAQNGTIYLTSTDKNLYAISPDGNLIWKFDTGQILKGSPSIAEDGTIYVGDTTGRLLAIAQGYIPILDYHFDDCEWDGLNDGIVKDSSIKARDATSTNVKFSVDGSIGSSAKFEGQSGQVVTSPLINDLNLSSWASSCWIKKVESSSSQQTILDADGIFNLVKTTDGKIQVTFNGTSISTAITDDNAWHFIVASYASGTLSLLVDGNIVTNTVNGMSVDTKQFNLYIGNNKDKTESAKLLLDEVNIFNVTSSFDISKFKDRLESTARVDSYTCKKPIFDYHFDECSWDGTVSEVKDSSGNGLDASIVNAVNTNAQEPIILNSYAEFKNDNQYVKADIPYINKNQWSVSFWFYPQNTIYAYRQLVRALDTENNEEGMFLITSHNSSGTNMRIYYDSGWTQFISTDKITADKWYHVALTYDGSKLKLYINKIKQANEGSPDYNGREFTGEIKIGASSHDTLIDEVKLYNYALSQEEVTTIYTNENSGKNADGTPREALICSQPIFNAVNQNGGCYNWDNNITTKIVGDDINLTILAGDSETNESVTDINITKLELLSFSDSNCSTLYDEKILWENNAEINASGCWNPSPTITLNHDKAVRCAKIRITGLSNGTELESNSTDTFSIRPEKFILEGVPTGKLTAEKDYTFKAKAVNHDGSTSSVDYNASVTPQSHKYFRDNTDGSAMAGDFKPADDFSFIDGLTTDTTLSFSDVGKVGLELKDINWTETDADDTPLEDRIIYLEQNMTFIPKEFNITFDTTPNMDNHGRVFTYYANDLANMSADLKNLNFKITAVGEKNGVMKNYHSQTQYYANDVNFTLGLSLYQSPIMSPDINESVVKDLNFIAGVATISKPTVNFNFKRERNKTQNPKKIQGTASNIDITAIDSIDTNVTGSITKNFTGDATFYYGRVKTNDIKTSTSPTTGNLQIQVYWDGTDTRLLPITFKQQSSSWYINADDNHPISVFNTFSAMKKRKLGTQSTGTTLNPQNMVNGIVNFSITKADIKKSQKVYYHIDIDPWLWYSRYEDYDFTNTHTCGEHPCFEYIFEAANNHGISSGTGDFNGTSFDNNFTSKRKRKALKIMR